ncbi:MAG: Maf family protein [Gammaproteobacteria bacterium]|nr:Maf family protein [Gammaproteobacteria bacterium]
MNLILASKSPYRKHQLQSLGYSFTVVPANIDESRLRGEAPRQLALRLAREKARKVSLENPEATVIGSDQVGFNDRGILEKPGNNERAVDQISRLAGQVVTFETALVVRSPTEREFFDTITTTIGFRNFTRGEAETYVGLDEPFDCVGAFKSEMHGPLLFEWVRSDDPSALVGLPLIRTSDFLRELGINPLAPLDSNNR